MIDQETLERFNKTDMCYVIQAANGGPVKIGHSVGVVSRLSGMQTGNPYLLGVRALLTGGAKTERAAHKRFSEWRACGEWFATEAIGLVCDWLDDNPLVVAGGRWSDQCYVTPAPTADQLRAKMRAAFMQDGLLSHLSTVLQDPQGEHFGWAVKIVQRADPDLSRALRSRPLS